MSQSEDAESFDWVKARAACSMESVFRMLAEVVHSDVKSANRLDRARAGFTINEPARDKVIVARQRDMHGVVEEACIVFELMSGEIKVRQMLPERRDLFSARPILNSEGMCLLEITGERELQRLWQVSRRALDDLFFGF